MIFGYARCSTNADKQDINRQIRELKNAGAIEIFVEYEHGDAIVKEQLSLLFEKVQAGDEIIVLEVSRLARSTKQLCEIIEMVKNKKLKLNILNSITVDCTSGNIDPMTNAFLQMAGVFSELELLIIRDRVKSGMANAKAKGKKIGRPQTSKDDLPTSFYKYYTLYKSGSFNISEFARLCNMSRSTVYKYINLIEEK